MPSYLKRGYNHNEHPVVLKHHLIYSKELYYDLSKDMHDCFITNSDCNVIL